jgi:hypothetical protein
MMPSQKRPTSPAQVDCWPYALMAPAANRGRVGQRHFAALSARSAQRVWVGALAESWAGRLDPAHPLPPRLHVTPQAAFHRHAESFVASPVPGQERCGRVCALPGHFGASGVSKLIAGAVLAAAVCFAAG